MHGSLLLLAAALASEPSELSDDIEWAEVVCVDLDEFEKIFTPGVPSCVRAADGAGYACEVSHRTALLIDIVQARLDGSTGSDLRPQIEDYARSWLAMLVAIVILAVLVVLLLLPLWIARCLAHRVCAPGKPGWQNVGCGSDPASGRRKALTGGCCVASAFGVVICVAEGCAVTYGVARGLKQASCGNAALLYNASEMLSCAEIATALMDSTLDETAAAVSHALGNATCVVEAFDDTAGSITQTCGRVSTSLTGLQTLDAAVLAATGTRASTASPLYSASLVSFEAIDAACTSLLDAQVVSDFEAAQGALETIDDSVSELYNSVDEEGKNVVEELIELWEKVSDNLNDWRDRQARVTRDLWDGVEDYPPPLYAFVLFSLACLSLVTAAVGVPLMFSVRKRFSGGKRRAWGVQCAGCAWVTASLWAVVMLLAGSVTLASGQFMTDAGGALAVLPYNMSFVLGPTTCQDDLTIDLGTDETSGEVRAVDMCGIVEGCWAIPSEDPFDSAAEQLGINITSEELRDQIDDAKADMLASHGDIELLETAQADLQAYPGCPLTPEDLGLTQADGLLYAQAESTLADACEAASLDFDEATLCAADMKTNGQAALNSSDPVVDGLEALEGCFNCEYIARGYNQTLGPLLAGSFNNAFLGLGVSLTLCGVLLLPLLASLIAAQIHFGHVNRTGGCPRCCVRVFRCCDAEASNKAGRKTNAHLELASNDGPFYDA